MPEDHAARIGAAAGDAGRDCTATQLASECTADSDCFLTPPRCCGCSGEPVAVSKKGAQSLRAALCGSASCGACAIPPYKGLSTACEKGHCVRRGRWKREGAAL